MATTFNTFHGGRPLVANQSFFSRMAIALAVFIMLAFAQFSARGMVNPFALPPVIHFHALAMTTWLGLFVTQNLLAGRGAVALHRRLGWASAALVAGIVVLGMAAGISAISGRFNPPFFTPAYFLVLTTLGPAVFGTVVAAAIAMRRDMEWHRRLMLVSTVLLMEPALGRIVPMPLTGAELGSVIEAAGQLIPLWLLARHDRATLGRVHPATVWGVTILLAFHVAVFAIAAVPAVAGSAAALAAG